MQSRKETESGEGSEYAKIRYSESTTGPLPESFRTFHVFKSAKRALAFALKMHVPKEDFQVRNYGGKEYVMVRYTKWSPRNQIFRSRKPQECKGRAKLVKSYIYNRDGEVCYIDNRFALVKVGADCNEASNLW